jgi:hypothetical protein
MTEDVQVELLSWHVTARSWVRPHRWWTQVEAGSDGQPPLVCGRVQAPDERSARLLALGWMRGGGEITSVQQAEVDS